jgi:hypothetical protein
MSSTIHRAEIDALFQQLVKAHTDHDADAVVEAYAPDAGSSSVTCLPLRWHRICTRDASSSQCSTA